MILGFSMCFSLVDRKIVKGFSVPSNPLLLFFLGGGNVEKACPRGWGVDGCLFCFYFTMQHVYHLILFLGGMK